VTPSASPSCNVASFQAAASFSGPLPPPQILDQYNESVPDGANRIISMAEEQSKHRMGLEKYVVERESRRSDLGLVAGLVVSLAFLGGSVFITVSGYPWAGAVIGTVDIVSLVGAFIYGSNARRKERESRIKALIGDS